MGISTVIRFPPRLQPLVPCCAAFWGCIVMWTGTLTEPDLRQDEENESAVVTSSDETEALVGKVKEMQRNDATAKEQWWAYCDSHGGGIHDPAKHDAEFIQVFLNQYNSGVRFEQVTSVHLAELFKEGQRKSTNWKNTWAQYCQHYGGGVHDPGKHEINFLVGFLDFLGQRGNLALSMMSSMMGVPMWQPNPMAPPAKRARVGDHEKDQLVLRVKAYQRSGEDGKQNWWTYCDNQLGGVRDPARHDCTTLQQFIAAHGVP